MKVKVANPKPRVAGRGMKMVYSLLCIGVLVMPMVSIGQEVNREGWPIPNLSGLIPYSMQVERVDGVEKVIERFYTPDGGHVARISGNGKIFAYVVDHDREPPADYLLLDLDGAGKFTQKFGPEASYKIPEWVSR